MSGAYLEAKGDSTRNARLRRVDYIVSYVGMSVDFLERKQSRRINCIIASDATFRAVTEMTTSRDGNDPSEKEEGGRFGISGSTSSVIASRCYTPRPLGEKAARLRETRGGRFEFL